MSEILLLFSLLGHPIPWPTSLSYSNPVMLLVGGPGVIALAGAGFYGISAHSDLAPRPVNPVTPIPVRPSTDPLPPPPPPIRIDMLSPTGTGAATPKRD